MTLYERWRVGLHIVQVFATISIPIIAVIIHEWLRKRRVKRYIESKYKYKYKYVVPEDVK
jgi:hypothetical protein